MKHLGAGHRVLVAPGREVPKGGGAHRWGKNSSFAQVPTCAV